MRTLTLIILVLLLAVLVSCLASPDAPAHAQGFATPTPLPAVQATLDAANAMHNDALSKIDAANQMQVKAAELLRNGVVQGQQADQAISDARAATAAQNAAAMGEAIGRASGALDELRKTNAAQNDMLNVCADNQKIQASAFISASNDAARLRVELQQERETNQNIAANFTALQNQHQQDERTSAVGNIASAFAFLVAGALLMVPLVVILFRKTRNEPPAPPEPPIDAPWTVTDEDRAEDEPINQD